MNRRTTGAFAAMAAVFVALIVLVALAAALAIRARGAENNSKGQRNVPCGGGGAPCRPGLRCVADSPESRTGTYRDDEGAGKRRRTCAADEVARCGGDEFCSYDGAVARCQCARADGTYVSVVAAAATPAPACHRPPEDGDAAALAAYRRAGGADAEESVRHYLAWDTVLGRWSTPLRARARDTAAWDEVRDPLPVFTSDPARRAAFCVSRLPESDSDAVAHPEQFVFARCDGPDERCDQGWCVRLSPSGGGSSIGALVPWAAAILAVALAVGVYYLWRRLRRRAHDRKWMAMNQLALHAATVRLPLGESPWRALPCAAVSGEPATIRLNGKIELGFIKCDIHCANTEVVVAVELRDISMLTEAFQLEHLETTLEVGVVAITHLTAFNRAAHSKHINRPSAVQCIFYIRCPYLQAIDIEKATISTYQNCLRETERLGYHSVSLSAPFQHLDEAMEAVIAHSQSGPSPHTRVVLCTQLPDAYMKGRICALLHPHLAKNRNIGEFMRKLVRVKQFYDEVMPPCQFRMPDPNQPKRLTRRSDLENWIVKTPGDGNCFYHAVTQYNKGKKDLAFLEAEARAMRKKMLDLLNDKRRAHLLETLSKEQLEGAKDRISKMGEWATTDDILIAMVALEQNIYVLTLDEKGKLVIGNPEMTFPEHRDEHAVVIFQHKDQSGEGVHFSAVDEHKFMDMVHYGAWRFS